MRAIKAVLALMICALVLGGCDGMIWQERDRRPPPESPNTLNDIAWDVDERLGYTVYILEDGEYAPYLVLTNDFNGSGNVLLLRQYLLDELRAYRYLDERGHFGVGVVASYYEDSAIDDFLNSEFYDKLPLYVMNKIIDSTIRITAIESIGIGGHRTISIYRKIFLLSWIEVNGNVGRHMSRINVSEGTELEYFSERGLRIAYHSNGEAGNWWLRTPSIADMNVVAVVTYTGMTGNAPINQLVRADITRGERAVVEALAGVRPAFCLPRDTPIKERELNGEMVFVLDLG